LTVSDDGHFADFGPLRLRPLAALDTMGAPDETYAVEPPVLVDDGVVEVRRRSTAWEKAVVTLALAEDGLEVRTHVRGRGALAPAGQAERPASERGRAGRALHTEPRRPRARDAAGARARSDRGRRRLRPGPRPLVLHTRAAVLRPRRRRHLDRRAGRGAAVSAARLRRRRPLLRARAGVRRTHARRRRVRRADGPAHAG